MGILSKAMDNHVITARTRSLREDVFSHVCRDPHVTTMPPPHTHNMGTPYHMDLFNLLTWNPLLPPYVVHTSIGKRAVGSQV